MGKNLQQGQPVFFLVQYFELRGFEVAIASDMSSLVLFLAAARLHVLGFVVKKLVVDNAAQRRYSALFN